MISPLQAILARTMLRLSQKEAAAHLGISPPTLSQIENGETDPPASRYQQLQEFYENNGVEFLNRDGVRRKAAGHVELRGYEGLKEFIYDVYETVRGGGDICVTNVDERHFYKWSMDYNQDYISKMSQISNLRFRILIQEGDDFFLASSYAQYRTLPSKYFGSVPTYIYGNKKAEIIFEANSVTIFVIENALLADAQRKLFDIAWEQSDEQL